MNVLALETSSEYCSIALWRDGALLERDVLAGQRHAEMILRMLEELLAEAACPLGALDGIAFGAGPGSFTGLRIACGIAQGLALGADLPVLGVCSLEALAEAVGGERVVACLDARMGEIYHAAYVRQGDDWQSVCPPWLGKAEQAPQLPAGQWQGVGSGFAAYPEALAGRYGAALAGVDAHRHPAAAAVAGLAARGFSRGAGLDAALAAPLYVRDKVALTTAEREQARGGGA